MRRLELVLRVRTLTRDFSNSIFREQDIIDFINEGINRFKQVLPILKSTPKLLVSDQQPKPIPEEYQHLLAVYSASRCFSQDERHYQATTLMNEFEVKLDELKQAIQNGDIVIVDDNGVPIEDTSSVMDYVDLSAYWRTSSSYDEGEFDVVGDV